MKRRTVLAALGKATVAGCVSDEPSDAGGTDAGRTDDGSDAGGTDGTRADGTVPSHFDGGPTRPDCTRESESIEVKRGEEIHDAETAATVPYPEPPTEFTAEAVLEYVEAFDHAYVTKDVLCGQRSGHVLRIAHTVETSETFDRDDGVTTVYLFRWAGATSGVDDQGYEWAAEVPPASVVYAVDEAGVARAEVDEPGPLEPDEIESRAPDPLEDGELVAVFE